ncbi:RNA polymerase sigma-70 factor [Plebeiibacterium marinum]|uniref:RNA polymerase sigma-70 factor n=1 Tax=Plebeiibacterium marinum TaxID=2992111 RepID=A0AAE3MGP1_9BACT|nr:RNA polymerase sigma-70 factor [Plebeiobacterium marinum]MCW3807508.1 RNA polymerase sigma-70 factor [Plebeiobacterium marinum]
MTEKNLVLRLKEGDEQAFELLYRKYFRRLCAFANKYLHDYEVTQEVVQDVFYTIWEKREHLDADKSILSFLFQSAKNKSIHILEHSKVKNKYKEVLKYAYSQGDYFDVQDSMLAKELEAKLGEIIESLPEKCRKIFLLSRQEGKKYKEIAEELDISVKTVETQMSRALKVFRTELKDYLSVVLFAII